MRPIIFLVKLIVWFLLPITVFAQYPNALLTPSERTTMLAEKLNSSTALTRLQFNVTPFTAATLSSQADYRSRYIRANLGGRVAIAQAIGEEGVEKYASTQRLKQLLGPRGRSVPIGPDSVFLNPTSGKVLVLEAKGGSSQLNWTYGTRQGTNSNTIRSAAGILRSNSASLMDKQQAARVIVAARNRHLETGVIQTRHVLGTPSAPRQINGFDRANVAREARLLQRRLENSNSELRKIFRSAEVQHRNGRVAAFPQALAQRTPGVSSMPRVATVGGRGLQRILQTGNRYVLPIGLSAAGATVAVYGYRYGRDEIGREEFLEASAPSAVFLAFTATGAAIGSTPGAVIGATLALPVQIYLWFASDNTLRGGYLSPQQLAAVDAMLEEFYLASAN